MSERKSSRPAFDVWRTPIGEEDYRTLRADVQQVVDSKEDALARDGCAAADYRLSGESADRFCSLHLMRGWRMIVGFQAPQEVAVLRVGRQIQAGIDGAGDAIVIWNDMVDGEPRGISLAVLHTRTQDHPARPQSVPARDGETRHLTVANIARATNADESTVRAWLREDRSPSGAHAERLAELAAIVERMARVMKASYMPV